MKSKIIVFVVCLASITISFAPSDIYDPSYVTFSKVKQENGNYYLLYMNRTGSGNKIKVKYFSAKDPNTGETVASRYKKWRKGKNIIGYSSAGYMVSNGYEYTPDGFNVDNGTLVNTTMETAKFDALVVVYATGGVVATNLKDGDLTLGDFPNRKFDLRKKPIDKATFEKWCETNNATVFQTHLLAYKDVMRISSYNSSNVTAQRRFLAVGYESGDTYHAIVQIPGQTTLYEGSKRAFDFLKKYKGMEIVFLINLDTGMQDVCQVYKADGSTNNAMVGTEDINSAVNLLVYYYE
ncbi:MAG: hypothetical protein ACO3O0_00595 [Bacteroidia bacterium]